LTNYKNANPKYKTIRNALSSNEQAKIISQECKHPLKEDVWFKKGDEIWGIFHLVS
jgi:hypothetical protein